MWNARQSPPGTLKINRCSAPDFSFFHLGVALSSAGFISEFLCLSLVVVVYNVLCVCTSLRRSEPLGSLLVLGLNVLPFDMHFTLVVIMFE